MRNMLTVFEKLLLTAILICFLCLSLFSDFSDRLHLGVHAESDAQSNTSVLFTSQIPTNYTPLQQIKAYEIPETFSVIIPSIGLNKEIKIHIDPRDRSIYLPVIEHFVAHGLYTYTPDMIAQQGYGITYLFAHRDGESGFFNRLDELQQGDRLYLQYGDKKYEFEFSKSYVVSPDQVEVYTSESSTPLLRLQTCENGLSQRLMIDAELIGTYNL